MMVAGGGDADVSRMSAQHVARLRGVLNAALTGELKGGTAG
jgi:hypothetical protein